MSIKIKNLHRLKKKDINKIFDKINNTFSIEKIEDKLIVETGIYDGVEIIFVDEKPCFMNLNDDIIFNIHGILKFKPRNKFVVVDMGAVKFVTSGADVMAPGIIDADEDIIIDDQVWIYDELHHKPLAVGIALMSGSDMVKEKKGKSVKIIHYVGDKYWNII